MAWGQFASLWAVVELQCRGCAQSRQVTLPPFAVVAIFAAFGLSPIAMAKQLFKQRPRWYNFSVLLLAILLAIPFLIFGLMFFMVALVVKFAVYLAFFAKQCPACGRRRWQVSNYGILDFLSIYYGAIMQDY
jgi:uncharacterized membrane protein